MIRIEAKHTNRKRATAVFALLVLLPAVAFNASARTPDAIRVASPVLDGFANADGSGLWFELVRAVYEPLGIMMQYELLPLKRARKALDEGEADAIPGLKYEPERLMPRYPIHVKRPTAVFKRNRIGDWRGPESLQGKTAVWMRGMNYEELIRERGINLQWHAVDDWRQAWELLRKDRVDVYIDAIGAVSTYVFINDVDMDRYRMEPLFSVRVYLSFSETEKSKRLIDIYDRRMPELLRTGVVEALYNRWDVPFPSFEPRAE